MRFKKRLKANVKIDMTPMIDAVFLLLIFFMITSSIIKDPSININMPKASSSESQPDKDLVVTLSKTGVLYLNETKILKKNLYRTLKYLHKKNGRNFLIIRADEGSDYGKVVNLLDIARLAGIENASLATRR